MTEPLPSGFPEPLDDDDDDVAWALQTAKVQWQRAGKADAIVWIGRAADSADQLGNVWRAAELRRVADEFTSKLSSVRPAFSRPPPVSTRGRNDIDDLLGGGTRPPPPPPPLMRPTPPMPLPSYAPVEADDLEADDLEADDLEIELESRPATFNEIVIEDPASRAEFVSIDEYNDADDDEDAEEIEPEPDSEEVAEIEEVEAIDDDALDLPVPPLPSFASGSRVDPGSIDYSDGEDDPVTQPQLEDPLAFPASKRNPISQRVPEPEPRVGDLLLGEVRGLEDLPPESQALLAREAHIALLNNEEEISSFGLALVLKGAVNIMPAIADLSCARATKGDIVWGQGNLEDGVVLRLVAAEDASQVAVWDAALIKGAIRDCPWVIDDLKALADRFQALAGVAMGPMGERLDDSLRAMVTGRCEIKRLLPNEVLATRGKPVGGMYIAAAGRIEILDDAEEVELELGPGDFVFAPQVLSNGAAPSNARAGKGGALLLFAGRSVAHELLLSVPPLLEIFAS
ncbi:MAG: hypothetical protein ABI548_11740 [Polyangiaceae bacterium]